MSIEVRPVGVTCNLRCSYCYEQSLRDVNPTMRYNKDAVMAQIRSSKQDWSLFGGEALILPLADIEELLKVGYEQWGKTGIQTNGTLITPEHVTLFERYNTHIGISLDGPDELNDSRWAGTLEATRAATTRTLKAIDLLLERAATTKKTQLIPSLIVTLYAGNASVEAWPKMKAWLSELDQRGIRGVNFHVMELDYKATKSSEFYLPHERIKEVLLDLWELSTTFKNIQILNFKEIIHLLRGEETKTMCVWRSCDPWNTAAVQGLEGDGSPSHCTRTNKDGIDWLPAEGSGMQTEWHIGNFYTTNRFYERQLSLYVTPQEHGGCKDCRFWSMCKGQCPGTGEESEAGRYGDWRLRSSYCQTWKDLFEEGERRLQEVREVPLSRNKNLKKIEELMYESWKQGSNMSLDLALEKIKNPPTKTNNSNIIHIDIMDDSCGHLDGQTFLEHDDATLHPKVKKMLADKKQATSRNHIDHADVDLHYDGNISVDYLKNSAGARSRALAEQMPPRPPCSK